jgi:hypothetical protein
MKHAVQKGLLEKSPAQTVEKGLPQRRLAGELAA